MRPFIALGALLLLAGVAQSEEVAEINKEECIANMTKLLEFFKEEFPKQVPDVIDIKGSGRKPGKSAMLLTGFQDTQLVTPVELVCSNQTDVAFVIPLEGRAAVYLGPAIRPDVARTYFKATVKLNGVFNLLKGPSLDKIEVIKTSLDNVQLLDSSARDANTPPQQFVARVCATLIKKALGKEVPTITKNSVNKSLADFQKNFINSSVAALEKRGVQIYKLLESMLKTNKDGKNQQPITNQEMLTRMRSNN